GQRLLDLLAGRHSWLSGCSYFQRKSV
ncbi:restriction endonuclease, partial [Salmonella enterica subsp. enterica serovar Livingstone]|nr:restriction endonuclease [Salmonella enterica subsp. enterica serovar Livingstone]